MRTVSRILALSATSVALALPAAPALASAPSTSGTFGQHVATCAHESGGFTGTHNPGMHQGAAGWDGQTCE